MNMTEEIWRDIKDYEGLYMVSNLGRVKNVLTRKGKILSQSYSHSGYLMVGLNKNGVRKTFRVNRLVAISFIPNNDGLKNHVNHINEIKDDNRASNLEWMTAKENANYGSRNKKMAASLSQPIIVTGNGIKKRFSSMAVAAKELNLNLPSMSLVLNGKRKHTKGYTFKRVKVYGGGVSHD